MQAILRDLHPHLTCGERKRFLAFANMDIRSAKIAVVGSGAVGCYYGGMLARSGCDVRFLMRSDLETVRERGLTIHTQGTTFSLPRVQAFGSTAEIGPCDLVLIALKATVNHFLLGAIPPLLKSDTVLLTLQNGLGNEEFLAGHWGGERVMGALCFVCLNRAAPGIIDHLDHGSISIGEFQRRASDRLRSLTNAFQLAGVDAKPVDDLANERWRKLLWNIPFNGLSIAGNGATVAEVLADKGLRKLARDLMDEVLEAARRLGHDIPASFADHQIQRSFSMGPYRPSSLVDWQLSRPVEVEAIWGEPWRQGVAASASLPRLEMLYRLLQRLCRADGEKAGSDGVME